MRRAAVALLLWFLSAPGFGADAAAAALPVHRSLETPQTIEFDVSFDGKALGTHRYQLTPTAQGLEVLSEARLRYRLAFVSLFRYDHEAREQWQDGCLTALESTTNDDGKRFAVRGQQRGERFEIERTKPTANSADLEQSCPATFAYWDRALLKRSALVNAQTGQAEQVSLTEIGEREIDGIPAEGYLLRTEAGAELKLWYAKEDDRWLRLETERDKGTLIYERKSS